MIAFIYKKEIFLLISSIMQINIQKKNFLSNNIFYLPSNIAFLK